MMINVLYAEDESSVAEFVRLRLRLHSKEVKLELVDTGRACLERMKSGGIDVLLIDLMLPDIDGLLVLNQLAIRGDPTPVIVVSGHGHNEMAVKAMRAGAIDCVHKASPEFTDLYPLVLRAYNRRASNPLQPQP